MESKTKSIVAGIAIGLAVIMAGGALGLSGKALGWYDKGPKEPAPTLEALNFEETVYGTYAVSLKDYEATEIVVPSQYNGKPVTEIAGSDAMQIILLRSGLEFGYGTTKEEKKELLDRAVSDFVNMGGDPSVAYIGEVGFAMSSKLTKITLPSSVKKINEGAFLGCTSLTEIEIPEGVTQIGDFAFEWCYSLKSIEIPESVEELGNDVFYYNYDLETVKLPEGIKRCGRKIFAECESLRDVNIPKFDVIPAYMFYGCKALDRVILPESVKTISEYAFSQCLALPEIVLPKTLTEIENNAFVGCMNLKTIYNLSSLVLTAGSSAYGYIAKNATNIYPEMPVEAGVE